MQTARDPLASETERLAFDIILYTLGRRTGRASDETARCLRTSVDRMLDKHALVFNSMVGRLRVNRSSDLRQGFLNLSDELFQREEVRQLMVLCCLITYKFQSGIPFRSGPGINWYYAGLIRFCYYQGTRTK